MNEEDWRAFQWKDRPTNDVAWFQRWCEQRLRAGGEGVAIHRAIDQ